MSDERNRPDDQSRPTSQKHYPDDNADEPETSIPYKEPADKTPLFFHKRPADADPAAKDEVSTQGFGELDSSGESGPASDPGAAKSDPDASEKHNPQDASHEQAAEDADKEADKDEGTSDPEQNRSAGFVGRRRRPYVFSRVSDEDAKQHDTAVFSEKNRGLRRAIKHQSTTPDGTATLHSQREIILVIRGMVERILISDNREFKLGRFELGSREKGEIDLTPYGALDRGVSRVHARLHLEDGHLYVTDLGSTNGTYLAGKRLEPHQPTMLRKGDELLVGRLAVQVMFR